MFCQFSYSWSEDAEGVFENLKGIQVEIRLDDRERREAITAIENLVEKIHDWYKQFVVKDIFYAVLKELFKFTLVDDDMIAKVIEMHSVGTSSEDDDEEELKFEEEFDRVSEIDEVDWEVVADLEGVEIFKKIEKNYGFVPDDDVIRAKDEAVMKQFADEAIKDFEEQCRMMGCTLKKDQQSQILDRFFSWYLDRGMRCTYYPDMQRCIKSFMNEVEYYIARTCVLDDLETVTKAIEVAGLEAQTRGYIKNVKFDGCEMEVDYQLVEKITAPTNEEGITTPVNQFKQEQRSSGVECEIFTPMNLVERKQIFPTTPEQTKVCGNLVTPLKQEQEEEYIVNVDICLTPECTSPTRKRKLEELSQRVVIS